MVDHHCRDQMAGVLIRRARRRRVSKIPNGKMFSRDDRIAEAARCLLDRSCSSHLFSQRIAA
jgi:hypothetical protein